MFIRSPRTLRIAIGVALVSALALTAGSAAVAATDTTDFESPTYAPGSIQGQDGWAGTGGAPINPAYDQEIVATADYPGAPASFGGQSFRISNAVTSGSFGDWPFSPSLSDEAGESSAASGGYSGGSRQTHFEAALDIASATPTEHQPGLQISFAPDRGDGARMSFLKVYDTSGGLAIDFADYQSGLNELGCYAGTNFVTTTVASDLDRSVRHSVRLVMDFVDGFENDFVAVYVDDALVHVGTSWEDYFRECESNPTRTVDSLIFQARSGGGTAASTLGNGFLIDEVSLDSSVTSTLGPCPVAINGSSPTLYTLLADCITDHTIVVPQHAGGTIFDGNGHEITGGDPVGGHFLGAVVQAAAGPNDIKVKNLIVSVDGLADVCDGGVDRLRGILFDGVGGVIRDTTVTGIDQGASGCQEGNAIEVRKEPFTKGGADVEVTIRDNVVDDYQKTGIIANGSVAATIRGNVVTGAGPVNYIAQNGIQVGFGATAIVRLNSVSGNDYTPLDTVACGLLMFEADGVKQSSNVFFANEKNVCNFGRGGGNFKPSV